MKGFPVVDGDAGAVDQYGFATTERGALRVAGKYFADKPASAYLSGNVRLRTGELLARAWVVVVVQP